MARRDLALRLRDARRADRRLETVAQYKQAMTAPDWEMDDYDWCVQLCCCSDIPARCVFVAHCVFVPPVQIKVAWEDEQG